MHSPQLPRRSPLESMYLQFSQGFPGAVVKDDKIYVDQSHIDKPLEALYAAYLENDTDKYPVTADYAAVLHHFLARRDMAPLAVKVSHNVAGAGRWRRDSVDGDHAF